MVYISCSQKSAVKQPESNQPEDQCWLSHGLTLNHLSRRNWCSGHCFTQEVTERCEPILGTRSTYQNNKNVHINTCPEIFSLRFIAERILSWPIQFLLSVLKFVIFGRPACFSSSAYRQLLSRFPRTWSAKATGGCTSGRARMLLLHILAVLSKTFAEKPTITNE
jgi:hypothetical protein